eukprot:TRINITY_DN1763_c0_g1_i2.p1 TRINITY_DN1763_c0_g1~~TRINITY_DN1763_c0_g1_i2.p1  ORF type:complete len:422 (+),score=135.57 TRINITY_DN1763_c0_g1_i2:24-1268(+)
MGIKGLAQLLESNAPSCIVRHEMKTLFGRKVAIDASMSLYQFMVAVRTAGAAGAGKDGMAGPAAMLMNEDGEVTSHLQGLFYRTIRMMENGVKPCYVFEGKPPQMKAAELAKRSERREEAQEKLDKATEEANVEEIDKMNKRLVKVSPEHNAEARKLLVLMGLPVVEAAGEAEAQCAALCKAGKVWATATEDMDALTFGSPILLRHMTFSAARKVPVAEFQLNKALEDLGVTMDQFIDICILSGCDYLDTIRGIGPTTALKLVKKHGSLENVLKNLDSKKYQIPENYDFEAARKLFKEPELSDVNDIHLEWNDPDEDGLIEFLVNQKGFNADRVKSGIKKLKASKAKSTQKRMADFFGAAPAAAASSSSSSSSSASGPPPAKKSKTSATPSSSASKKPTSGASKRSTSAGNRRK